MEKNCDMQAYIGDLEADGLLDTATQVWCGVFKNIATGVVTKFRPHQIKQMLAFMDTVPVLIMHNGIGYDWPLLTKLYGYEYKGVKVDTLLMSRLLNPKRLIPPNCTNRKAGPHSVEAWGYRVGRGKPEHNDWAQFSEEMLHRCSEDVEIQELIYRALQKEAEGGDWAGAFRLTHKLFEYLQQQEEYGWKVDREHMDKCIHQLDHFIARIDRALKKHLPCVVEIQEDKIKGEYKYVKKPFLKSGEFSASVDKWIADNSIDRSLVSVCGPFSRVTFRPVNLDSNEETKLYLIGSGWEPLEWNTNDEGERTSPKLSKDDPFEGIVGGIGRLVAKRVQCRQRKSIIEGLIALIRPDGRISSRVNTLAATGRATHRNIVNIPKVGSFYGKQMRKIFICSKGKVLVGTDSDACQLRMLAGRMGDPAYIEAMVNGDKTKGTDNHSITARVGELESRDNAKNVMYCLLFGGGDAKLAKTAKKPIGTGADLRAKLYRGLGGLGELVEKITNEWRSTAKKRFNPRWNKIEYYEGTITGLDGRPIKVPYEHQILVYLLQSDEAIMMAAAYVKANADLSKKYRQGEQYGFVAWYHDEYTIECDTDIAEDVKRIAEDAIAWAGNYFKIACPHLGDGKIGKSWYEIH